MSIFEKLSAPFPPEKISWRVGATTKDKSSGMALAYIDARDVMERLDEAVGPENWQNRYTHATGKTVCEIGIRVNGDWVWKSDGAGDTDTEAEKGALSDAFKRTGVRWGIGRYLYDVTDTWVALKPRGSSYVIDPGEFPKLKSLLKAMNVSKAPKSQSREPFDKIKRGIDQIERDGDHAELDKWYGNHVAIIETFPPDWHAQIMDAFSSVRAALTKRVGPPKQKLKEPA